MTHLGACVEWVRKSTDTTYRSTAKNRCVDCRSEVKKGFLRCRPCGYQHAQRRKA
jgi:hypothetical protein